MSGLAFLSNFHFDDEKKSSERDFFRYIDSDGDSIAVHASYDGETMCFVLRDFKENMQRNLTHAVALHAFFGEIMAHPLVSTHATRVQPPDQDCCICTEHLVSRVQVVSKCNHWFHFECLQAWTRRINRCPVCRNNDPI